MSLRGRLFDALLRARFRVRVAVDTVALIGSVAFMVARNGFAHHAVVEGRAILWDYLAGVTTIMRLWKVGTRRQRRQVLDSFEATR